MRDVSTDDVSTDVSTDASTGPTRIEARRTVAAAPAAVFAVLCDPQGHVAIDASGMLMGATGSPVTGVDDEFVVHMDREALGDRPMGLYDVTVRILAFTPDREIAWGIRGRLDPPVGHTYGYRLAPTDDGGTEVTSYCDWSDIHPTYRGQVEFPVIHGSSLAATLGILARTVARGYPRL